MAKNSSRRSLGDLGSWNPALKFARGDRGEFCVSSLADLIFIGEFEFFVRVRISFVAAVDGVSLTCSGVGFRGLFLPSPDREYGAPDFCSYSSRATPAPNRGASELTGPSPFISDPFRCAFVEVEEKKGDQICTTSGMTKARKLLFTESAAREASTRSTVDPPLCVWAWRKVQKGRRQRLVFSTNEEEKGGYG